MTDQPLPEPGGSWADAAERYGSHLLNDLNPANETTHEALGDLREHTGIDVEGHVRSTYRDMGENADQLENAQTPGDAAAAVAGAATDFATNFMFAPLDPNDHIENGVENAVRSTVDGAFDAAHDAWNYVTGDEESEYADH